MGSGIDQGLSTAQGYLDSLTGKAGLDTAAAGAREASAKAQAFSDLQWQRQMQGLQEARQQFSPYHSLYDQIYGTKTSRMQPPPGGGQGGAGMTFAGTAAGGQPPPSTMTPRTGFGGVPGATPLPPSTMTPRQGFGVMPGATPSTITAPRAGYGVVPNTVPGTPPPRTGFGGIPGQ